mmetsp:Transcript_78064/g.181070  ORF Transcript_78064/g.181070 Transcript_78064/m.181070 type:complete len:345 (+) Transcript_78064:79-1113(+)
MEESPRLREVDEAQGGRLGQRFVLTKQVIYRGLASSIFLGVERGTLLQVGVKVILKNRLDSEQELAQALAEVKIHSAIPPSAHVIRLLGAEETPNAILIVTPYTPSGDLWELIRFGKTYCEAEVRNCAGQMMSALSHIHGVCHLIHGDIKPHNFLLFMVDGRFSLQLCDFGLAEHPDRSDGTVTFHGLRGTSGWFSPEMLDHRDYTQAVDLFACGLILFRMLGGYPPFDPPSQLSHPVEFDERYWCHISEPCRQFLSQLLALDPADRSTASESRFHDWLTHSVVAPSPEQVRAARKYGPAPDTSVLFWPTTVTPVKERHHSYANLEDLKGEVDLDMEMQEMEIA